MSDNEPTSTNTCCHSEIIELTAQDNLDDLTSTLLKIVRQTLPGRPFRLYLHEQNNKWRLSGGNQETDLINQSIAETDIQLLHGINENTSNEGSEHSNETITIIPVRHFHSSSVAAALIIDNGLDSAEFSRACTYLQIFANNYHILHCGKYDALTGLLNREAFDDKCSTLFDLSNRKKRRTDAISNNICLAVIDIDHFKSINDRFGHLYGDEVLVTLARLMVESFRDEDLVFRYGGEEFVVILKHVDDDAAFAILDRFRQRVEGHDFPLAGQVTISIGFTSGVQQLPVTTIFGHADQALYYAKNHGRNVVINYLDLNGDTVVTSDDIELF